MGHFLNVHEGPLCAFASLAVYAEPYEGPHGIGVRIGYNASALKAGMTVSNEPGFYADGRFGIRIESIVLVRDAKTPNNFGEKGYLGFEHITMSVSFLIVRSSVSWRRRCLQVSDPQESHRHRFIDFTGAQVAERLSYRSMGQGLAVAAE